MNWSVTPGGSLFNGPLLSTSSVSEKVVFANSRRGICCCDWIDAEVGKTEILDEKTYLLFDIA